MTQFIPYMTALVMLGLINITRHKSVVFNPSKLVDRYKMYFMFLH
jgi:hypothetical protein